MTPDREHSSVEPDPLSRLDELLRGIDAADFELVEPPQGLWDRIAASVAPSADETREASPSVVEYSIDADDVVITRDQGWAAFARQNDAPELVAMDSSRTIWSYFGSDEIRDIWRLLIERVREAGQEARIPFRCDAPDMRRWYEMTLTPEDHRVVRFRSVLVFEEARDTIPLLAPDTDRDVDAAPIPVCSWCGQGNDGTRWIDIEDLARDRRLLESQVPSISYGICPTCRDLMSADLLVGDSTRGSSD